MASFHMLKYLNLSCCILFFARYCVVSFKTCILQQITYTNLYFPRLHQLVIVLPCHFVMARLCKLCHSASVKCHHDTDSCTNCVLLPCFFGGSADLPSSSMTLIKTFGNFQKDTPEERKHLLRSRSMEWVAFAMVLLCTAHASFYIVLLILFSQIT